MKMNRDESTFVSKICRSLEEASEITPYFNIVKQNANQSTFQTLENFSQIYFAKVTDFEGIQPLSILDLCNL